LAAAISALALKPLDTVNCVRRRGGGDETVGTQCVAWLGAPHLHVALRASPRRCSGRQGGARGGWEGGGEW
jgi:hypothetical protein